MPREPKPESDEVWDLGFAELESSKSRALDFCLTWHSFKRWNSYRIGSHVDIRGLLALLHIESLCLELGP